MTKETKMSIFENVPRKRTKMPSQKTDPKQILNDKSLTDIVKGIKGGPSSAKEIVYDSDKNILGVLQNSGEPFIFDSKQLAQFTKLNQVV